MSRVVQGSGAHASFMNSGKGLSPLVPQHLRNEAPGPSKPVTRMITVKITREIVHEASYEDACSVQHAVDMAHRSAQYCGKVTKQSVEVTVSDAKATGSQPTPLSDAFWNELAEEAKQKAARSDKEMKVPDYLIDPATWHAQQPPKPDANTAQPLEDKPPIRGTIGGLADVYGINAASNDPLYGKWSPSSGVKEHIIAAYERMGQTGGSGSGYLNQTFVSTSQDPGEPAPI